MKKIIFACMSIMMICCVKRLNAQDDTQPRHLHNQSFAVSAHRFGNQDGFGLEYSSKAFIKRHIFLRAKALQNWSKIYYVKEERTIKYYALELSMAYTTILVDRVRFVAEAGLCSFASAPKPFNQRLHYAASQSIGLELLLSRLSKGRCSYYFQIGAITNISETSNSDVNHHYVNSVLFSNGLRYYF